VANYKLHEGLAISTIKHNIYGMVYHAAGHLKYTQTVIAPNWFMVSLLKFTVKSFGEHWGD